MLMLEAELSILAVLYLSSVALMLISFAFANNPFEHLLLTLLLFGQGLLYFKVI